LAAISGGVDSAVAAARLVAAGHQVTGMYMNLFDRPGGGDGSEDAAAVARALGIPFEVWDLREEFGARVMDYFVDAYGRGLTPNPCVRCNRRLKFGEVLDRALARGFDAVATGHYANVRVNAETGRTELSRAAFMKKDQSYFLAVAGPERLAHAVFPLGPVPSKQAVREEAERDGLPVAHKAESNDICFIPDGDTAGFLRSHLGERPGDIVDQEGSVIGHHRAAYAFTVGQRRGLHLDRVAEDGRPRYVTGVDVPAGIVRVGPAQALAVPRFTGLDPVWYREPPEELDCLVQVRAHGTPFPAHVVVVSDDTDSTAGTTRLEIVPETPLRGLASGQAAVLYDGDLVIAEATIAR
jgi:tRNA-specific 2-thiouridylase